MIDFSHSGSLLFHLRHPNSKTNEPKFWQILSPKNSFAKTSSVLKPHALPEYLEGRTPKEKHLSFFRKNRARAKSEMQGVFFLSGLLAYSPVRGAFPERTGQFQATTPRGACEVITSLCFENRCEFGTIEAPKQNSKVFLKQKCGTREARPKDSRRIPPTNSEFLARLRALFFRQEAGAKSEAILTHSICLIQKEFLLL